MDESAARDSFEAHADFLRAVGYRMLGSAADAEDLVQDTFLRLLERPPPSLDTELRPWLTRVAMNLGRDRLRSRKRRTYIGPWLPSPVPTPEVATDEAATRGEAPDGRIERLESFSFAFLLALEALTPNQRAVFLLRELLDHSVQDSAEILEMSESNVKTTLHRARHALAARGAGARIAPSRRRQLTRDALERFLGLVVSGDREGLVALLREDARLTSDGGGVYIASRRPIVGAEKIARTYLKLFEKTTGHPSVTIPSMNGMPAICIRNDGAAPGYAPLIVIRVEVDADGRIGEIHSILAPDKLTALDSTHGTSFLTLER